MVTKVRFAAEPTRDNDDHLFNDADVSSFDKYSYLWCPIDGLAGRTEVLWFFSFARLYYLPPET